MKNVEQTIILRLRNLSKEKQIPFQQILNLFFQEEFSRRLAKSSFKNHLILKGGYLIFTLSHFVSRPTIDSDYLMKSYSNDLDSIKQLIESIINIKTHYDYLRIDLLGIEMISEANLYSGARVKLLGLLANTKTPFSIDIGVGDKVFPNAIERQLPVLLDDFINASVLCYSVESVIAEKLDAILRFMEYTGRMKDFYDIYYLSRNFRIKVEDLQIAIKETFQTRNTIFDQDSIRHIKDLAKNEAVRKRWNLFCENVLQKNLAFDEVIEGMISVLNQPLQAILENEISEKCDN